MAGGPGQNQFVGSSRQACRSAVFSDSQVACSNGWARERNEARDPEYDGNSRLNGWNWLGIVLGIAWWLLIISAMAGLLPEE